MTDALVIALTVSAALLLGRASETRRNVERQHFDAAVMKRLLGAKVDLALSANDALFSFGYDRGWKPIEDIPPIGEVDEVSQFREELREYLELGNRHITVEQFVVLAGQREKVKAATSTSTGENPSTGNEGIA